MNLIFQRSECKEWPTSSPPFAALSPQRPNFRMSLPDFQRAFAVVVADPASWAARLAEPDARIGDLELSERERERLRQVLLHPRMPANHVLLRANRLMPIQSALPLTCNWLRTEMTAIIDAWLTVSVDASVQYGREVARFAAWLPSLLEHSGHGDHPALDALRYEQAVARLASLVSTGTATTFVDLDFHYDPDDLLRGWSPGLARSKVPIATRLRVADGMIVLDRCRRAVRPENPVLRCDIRPNTSSGSRSTKVDHGCGPFGRTCVNARR
jgi:hypothetical protein